MNGKKFRYKDIIFAPDGSIRMISPCSSPPTLEKSFVFVRSVLVGGPLPTLPPSAPSPQIEKYGGSAMQVGVEPCISNVTLL